MSLYEKLCSCSRNFDQRFPSAHFAELNAQRAKFMLAISTCEAADVNEDKKIALVTEGLDNIFDTRQLQGVYGSNAFAEMLFSINLEIRNKPVDKIASILNELLLKEL